MKYKRPTNLPSHQRVLFFTQIGVIIKWKMASDQPLYIASENENRWNIMEVKQAISVRNLKNCIAFDPVIPVPGNCPQE